MDREVCSVLDLFDGEPVAEANRYLLAISHIREILHETSVTKPTQNEAEAILVLKIIVLYKLGFFMFREQPDVINEIERLFFFDIHKIVRLSHAEDALLRYLDPDPDIMLSESEKVGLQDYIQQAVPISLLPYDKRAIVDMVLPIKEVKAVLAEADNLPQFEEWIQKTSQQFQVIDDLRNHRPIDGLMQEYKTIFSDIIIKLRVYEVLEGNKQNGLAPQQVVEQLSNLNEALAVFISLIPGAEIELFSWASDFNRRQFLIRKHISDLYLSNENNLTPHYHSHSGIGDGINYVDPYTYKKEIASK